MKVSDFLAQLSYGELSNTRWGNNGDGTIQEEKIPATITFINNALLKLYTHFVLKEDFVLIELNEAIVDYVLDSKHARTNRGSPEKIKYILDSPAHIFRDDVLKILEVETNKGYRCPLNSHTIPWSLFTPQYNIVQVPHPTPGATLAVTYQCAPVKLFNVDQEIEIPPVLDEALRDYVAYMVHSNINTQESVANAQKYYQGYNQIIEDIDNQEILRERADFSSRIKFDFNGWI